MPGAAFGEDGSFNLALIHVSPLSAWFEFAPDVVLEKGLRAVAARFSSLGVTFASGPPTRDFERVDGPATQVRHSASLRDGDSGGPLIALDARGSFTEIAAVFGFIAKRL